MNSILSPPGPTHENGYDTEDGHLIVTQNMQILDNNGDYYTIIEPLGHGTFSDCYSALYSRSNSPYALKIMLSSEIITDYEIDRIANTELNISMEIETSIDLMERKYLHTTTSSFTYLDHRIIVSEVLGNNLYEILKFRNYRGLANRHVVNVAHMVSEALSVLHSHNFLHLDIKPENIVQARPNSNFVKLIDLGGSVKISECEPKRVAISLYYRPPEVILGYACTPASDIWSLGATIFELYLGLPLFMCNNEMELLTLITQTFGPLPKEMILNAPFHDDFYNNTTIKPNPATNPIFDNYTLPEILRTTDRFTKEELDIVIDFFNGVFALNPNDRFTIKDVLSHPFFNSFHEPEK